MCAMKMRTPKRILIVDDDIDLLMLLERRLQQEDYVVETAASIPEAEEMIHFFQPHLLLLDINVRGEDGRQLSLKLKMSGNDVPKVIIMSGYDYSTGRARLFGADDLLPKPLIFDYLLHRVRMLLGEEIINNQ